MFSSWKWCLNDVSRCWIRPSSLIVSGISFDNSMTGGWGVPEASHSVLMIRLIASRAFFCAWGLTFASSVSDRHSWE